MDFEQILNRWENQKGGGDSSQGGEAHGKDSPPSGKANWLDRYLPGREQVAEKEEDPAPPVSEGRSIWLRRPHQAALDLHSFTRREAERELARFIQSMRQRGLRKGLIIHGKGLHSSNQSILTPMVRDYLESSVEIGEFGRAPGKHGGSGATWFILRQRSR